jgi:DNA-binding MarR family transcriptional regulator
MNYTECIAFLLAKANQKSQSYMKKKLQPYGLTTVQHLILEVVMEHEGLTTGEIGKLLISDNATVSGVLDRMAESGWIVKETDPGDKRITRIFLGQKVNEIKDFLYSERESVNEDLLKNFSTEEKVLFKRLLKDFL